MRILGIDYGTKRIGIAMSDEAGQFALPLIVLPHSKNNLDEIVELAHKNSVKEIIIGESRDYKGQPNKILPEALALKEKLESKGLIVHLELEFMTSQQAERFQGKNNMTDASAAALILQAYLDKNKDVKK